MTDAEMYGLGDVRSRDQYQRFSSVDLDNRIAIERCDDIIADRLKLVPLNTVPQLKEKGHAVDPHPLLLE